MLPKINNLIVNHLRLQNLAMLGCLLTNTTASKDDFESYLTGSITTTLNGGIGWRSPFTIETNYVRIADNEDWESYQTGSTLLQTLNQGLGFSGNWVLDNLP